MKKLLIITFILSSILLVGCGKQSGNVTMSKAEYDKIIDEINNAEELSPTPTPTSVPDVSEEPSETELENVEDSAEVSGDNKPTINTEELTEITFHNPDVTFMVPSFLEEWPTKNFHDNDGGYCDWENKDRVTSVTIESAYSYEEDEINLATGEPIQYNENYLDSNAEVIEWSDENSLFKIHARDNEGFDVFSSVYRGDGYKLFVKIICIASEEDIYSPVFDTISGQLPQINVEITGYSEERIIELCQKKIGSPLAAVDHYDDNGNPVVHCFEMVQDEDGYHQATWAWIVVNPKTLEAVDDILGEPIDLVN